MRFSHSQHRLHPFTRRPFHAALIIAVLFLDWFPYPNQAIAEDYPIVYIRAPRQGDDIRIEFPEVSHPINAPMGSDLMLLHPDGSEELLIAGDDGAIADPYPSFDGKWIYYSHFYDQRLENKDRQRAGNPSRSGADIFKLNVETGERVQLTFQEWTPNTGLLNWSQDHLRSDASGDYYLGYGIFNLGPCPLPDGRIMFTSSRNNYLPNQDFTAPNQQLFVMDEDGSNVELIGHMNLGSALHPTILTDGRVMFSSYEAQGIRDRRLWGHWAIHPDGTEWEPLMSAFTSPSAFHFQTQLSNGDLAVVEYYNQNDNGFGTLLAFNSLPSPNQPSFGAPNSSHESNPAIQRGIWWFNEQHPSHRKPRYKRYSFSPQGLYGLTLFAHGEDNASSYDLNGEWAGKVTQPAGAPNNDVLLVWTPGPANDLNRPTNRPVYDAGIYVIPEGRPVTAPSDLRLVKNDPNFNELQPRALVSFQAIYGIEEPATLPENRNDGSVHPTLPAGTPFGLIGSSSFYRRDTFPSRGRQEFDGLDPFNTSQNNASSNWSWQGADAGKYANDDIYAVRIVAMEPSSHVARGPGIGNGRVRGFYNFAQERLRVVGEIPLKKTDSQGQLIRDPEGNPDTSFLARIPADTPFTFQTLDQDGLLLNMSQTWHQVRPGESRTNCGGCHSHSQLPLDFSLPEAATREYEIPDLARQTPLLSKTDQGTPIVQTQPDRAIDVEYYRDIKPILERSCTACHSIDGRAEAGLVLDDHAIVDGFENTYNRLARDQRAQYGIPPVIRNKQWRQTNASRYIRKFQSRRSLLIWKIFGRRLDGWTNEDHPTELIPGDPSSLPAGADPNRADLDFTGSTMPPPDSGYPPLSENEKRTFARWIDLGAPISHQEGVRSTIGWFADDLRPTLTLSSPQRGDHRSPLTEIRLGAFDYYTGLDPDSLSVTADFSINNTPPGTELRELFNQTDDHVWTLPVDPPIEQLPHGEITVDVKDISGNLTRIVRTFSITGSQEPPPPLKPSQLTPSLQGLDQVVLTWTPPALTPGIGQFNIYRDDELIATTTQSPYIDPDPNAGSNHEYQVASVTTDGRESERSDRALITIPPQPVEPPPPTEPHLDQPFDGSQQQRWRIIDEGTLGGPSDWKIEDGRMIQSSNIYALGMALNRKGTMAIWDIAEAYQWRDYLLNAQILIQDDDGVGLQFRYIDQDNFYRLDLDHLRHFRRLIRVVDGEATLLAAVYGGPPIGTVFDVTIQVQGNRIEVLLNGHPAFTEPIEDSSHTQGTVGLYAFANEHVEFHSLSVLAPVTKDPLESLGNVDHKSLPFSKPKLLFQRERHRLLIRWSDPDQEWTLESSPVLGPQAHWRPVEANQHQGMTDAAIRINPNQPQAYYRLIPSLTH